MEKQNKSYLFTLVTIALAASIVLLPKPFDTKAIAELNPPISDPSSVVVAELNPPISNPSSVFVAELNPPISNPSSLVAENTTTLNPVNDTIA